MKKLSIILICGLLAQPIQALTLSSFTSFFKQHWGKCALTAAVATPLIYYLLYKKTKIKKPVSYKFTLDYINGVRGDELKKYPKLENMLYSQSGSDTQDEHIENLFKINNSFVNECFLELSRLSNEEDKMVKDIIKIAYDQFPDINQVAEKAKNGEIIYDRNEFTKTYAPAIKTTIYKKYGDEKLNALPKIVKAYIFYKISSKYVVYWSYPHKGTTERSDADRIPSTYVYRCFKPEFYQKLHINGTSFKDLVTH